MWVIDRLPTIYVLPPSASSTTDLKPPDQMINQCYLMNAEMNEHLGYEEYSAK